MEESKDGSLVLLAFLCDFDKFLHGSGDVFILLVIKKYMAECMGTIYFII